MIQGNEIVKSDINIKQTGKTIFTNILLPITIEKTYVLLSCKLDVRAF